MNVIMTSPSLSSKDNVSGISSVVQNILKGVCRPRHSTFIRVFVVGKKDSKKRRFFWFLHQIIVPVKFVAFVAMHKPNVVHINGPLNPLAIPRDLLLSELARFLKRRVVYHVHGGNFVHIKPNNWFLRILIRRMLSAADVVLVLGDKEHESITKLYGVPTRRVEVMPNAIDFVPASDMRGSDAKLNILYMGRLVEEKGIRVLAEALRTLRAESAEIRLTVCGAGPLEEYVESEFSELLGEDFEFGGVVFGEEKVKVLSRADVLVLPSLYGEGLPMVLLEAMSAGVVPVASADGSIPELIKDGENGFLVDAGCSRSLSQALSLAIDKKKMGGLRKLGVAGEGVIKKKYNIAAYADKLCQVYGTL